MVFVAQTLCHCIGTSFDAMLTVDKNRCTLILPMQVLDLRLETFLSLCSSFKRSVLCTRLLRFSVLTIVSNSQALPRILVSGLGGCPVIETVRGSCPLRSFSISRSTRRRRRRTMFFMGIPTSLPFNRYEKQVCLRPSSRGSCDWRFLLVANNSLCEIS
jgi:hypothetical protein